MAELTDTEKLNLTLKQVFGVQGLNNADPLTEGGLRWFEEEHGWTPFIQNEEIFMESVPVANNKTEADNVASTSSVVEVIEHPLTLIPGVADRAWACYATQGDTSSNILGDWLLPQVFGRGYAAQLFEESTSSPGTLGDEIPTTEGAWIPSYKNGFIILGKDYTAPTQGWNTPLYIRAYRYTGLKGVSGSSASVSLDDAYNNGSIVDVDDGAVVLNPGNAYAPLQLTPVVSAPTQSLDEGQIANINGILYSYDATRSVWKSLYEMIVTLGSRFACGNYLSTGGFHSDLNAGYVAQMNGIITGITATVGQRYEDPSTLDKTFHIKMNGSQTSLYNFTTSSTKFSATGLDIRFDADDLIQIYAQPGPLAYSPVVNLHIAWRV